MTNLVKMVKMADKTYRTVAKTLSWRVTGTMDTIVVSYLVTGELKHAFAIGGVEVVTKMILYFFHERIWNKVKFGRIEDNQGIDYNI